VFRLHFVSGFRVQGLDTHVVFRLHFVSGFRVRGLGTHVGLNHKFHTRHAAHKSQASEIPSIFIFSCAAPPICNGPSVEPSRSKHEERESSRQQAAAEARKLHQKMLAQKGESVEQGPLPEDFAVEIKAGEGDAVVGPKDAKRAKTAGGSKVEHVLERERLSALLGIVASLRRRTTTVS